MIGSLISTQPAQSMGTTYDGFSGHFCFIFEIYYFSLFVPIFDLVDAVDSILLLLKLLRASQNLLLKRSVARENAICSGICIYHISEKHQMLLAVFTGYVLPRAIGLI